jgi:hypothetical protein
MEQRALMKKLRLVKTAAASKRNDFEISHPDAFTPPGLPLEVLGPGVESGMR